MSEKSDELKYGDARYYSADSFLIGEFHLNVTLNLKSGFYEVSKKDINHHYIVEDFNVKDSLLHGDYNKYDHENNILIRSKYSEGRLDGLSILRLSSGSDQCYAFQYYNQGSFKFGITICNDTIVPDDENIVPIFTFNEMKLQFNIDSSEVLNMIKAINI